MNNSGLKTITRSESLEQKSIYKVIFAVMNMIIKPFDNNVIADNYELLAETGLFKQRLGAEIKNFKEPFIQTDCDNIDNIHLAQFYWDLTYWLSFAHLTPDELAIKIGLYYFSSEIEKSNIYLISTLLKRLSANNKDFATIVENFGQLAKRPNLSGFKFFSEQDESSREFVAGKVQIMTMHKSKGDEFDYVFVPEFTEKNYKLNINEIDTKSSEFKEEIKNLNKNYNPKNENYLKEEQISETLRLLYVGITRAKKNLSFTTYRKSTAYGKVYEQEPSIIFNKLLEGVEHEQLFS